MTKDPIFLQKVLPNTFKFAVIVGPGGFILSFFMAWLLAQLTRGPRTVLAVILYSPSMIGGVTMSVVWKVISAATRPVISTACCCPWAPSTSPSSGCKAKSS